MDSTYWAILLGSAGVGMGIAGGMAHLGAARRPVTMSLSVLAVLTLLAAQMVGGAGPASAAPDGPVDFVVGVQARMYQFDVSYPVGPPARDVLVVPAGRTTRIDLQALDVVHAFWLPDLGVRATVVPGTPSSVLLRPQAPGEYRLLCAEFCGPDHAGMRGALRVLPPAQFDAWLAARRAG